MVICYPLFKDYALVATRAETRGSRQRSGLLAGADQGLRRMPWTHFNADAQVQILQVLGSKLVDAIG
ncbi:hypothetical protein RRG08_023851 [Elysia crispata]|uniref:Uncharacterized protein n=1 Tax=Elysia crispata TaxID=231223 RepID=A0AAE1ATH7_9GAST|nr:hypothetical protein RRG08_023851 [Elysia crispata]